MDGWGWARVEALKGGGQGLVAALVSGTYRSCSNKLPYILVHRRPPEISLSEGQHAINSRMSGEFMAVDPIQNLSFNG